MKDKNMKITKTLITVIAGLALIVVTAPAQTANNGIVASPKLREMMNYQGRTAAQPVAAAPHSCPMCQDEYTTRVDTTAKGVIKPTVTVLTHLCPGCGTSVSVTGQGKTAQSEVTHKCATGGIEPANCCAAKKS
jgi:hypothetical protein